MNATLHAGRTTANQMLTRNRNKFKNKSLNSKEEEEKMKQEEERKRKKEKSNQEQGEEKEAGHQGNMQEKRKQRDKHQSLSPWCMQYILLCLVHHKS